MRALTRLNAPSARCLTLSPPPGLLQSVAPFAWAEGHAVAELQDWRVADASASSLSSWACCDAPAPVTRRVALRPRGEVLGSDARALAARFAAAVRAHAATHVAQGGALPSAGGVGFEGTFLNALANAEICMYRFCPHFDALLTPFCSGGGGGG